MILHTQYRSTQILMTLFLCLLPGILWTLNPHPAVAIAIGLFPIAVLLTPFLTVLLFVMFSFFRIHEVFPQLYDLKLPLLLSMASLGAVIWHIGLTKKINAWWCPELTAISVFFGLTIIGIPMASNVAVAIEYFEDVYWKIIVMTFAIAWLTRTTQDFALAARLITFFGMLVALVAIFNKINGIGLVEETRVTIGRAIGSVLGDPNDLALVLLLPVAFATSLIMTDSMGRFTKLFGLFSVLVLFSAVIATQSRGGLLGIIAIFGVYGYRRIPSKALFFSLAGIAAITLFVLADISGRASGGSTETGIDASAMGRLYAWEAAYSMALHNPFSGVGINNFHGNYFFHSPHWDGQNHAVHSTWFGVLAEIGFPGLIVFITAIVMLVKTSLHSLQRIEQNLNQVDPAIHATAQAVLAGLLGTVVSATFLTQGLTWPIYILAALVIAVARWVNSHLPPTLATNTLPHNRNDTG